MRQHDCERIERMAAALSELLGGVFSEKSLPDSEPKDRLEHLEALVNQLTAGAGSAAPSTARSAAGTAATAAEEAASRQQENEFRLHESEEHLRTVIKASVDVIVAINSRGNITTFNPAAEKMFGFSAAEVVGQPVEKLIPGNLSAHHQSMVRNYFERGEPSNAIGRTLSLSAAHRNGATFPIELSLSAGSVDGEKFVFAMIRDISDRAKAAEKTRVLQKKLERAERMQSLAVLAGGVAHDLNNELGPLVGYPDLILDDLDEDHPHHKMVECMRAAAQRAADTIQDLLSLSRRGRYSMTPTSLNGVVADYLESPHFASLQKRNPGVFLHFDLDDSIAEVFGSSAHLSKVVMNLIGNAFDAMPEGGELHVKTAQQHLEKLFSGYDQMVTGEYVLLRVRDTGVGIPPNDLERIFEPYFSRKEMGSSGTGLGLAVVYGIVKDHNGFYDVFSTPDEGTEFVLYFPITSRSHPIHPEKTTGYGGTESVLVVDDAPQQRQLVKTILTSEGYTAEAVADRPAALDFLRDHEVDIVILDMLMDHSDDGLDTYREILKIRPGQKAIVISGSSQTERVRRMQRLGVGDYVRKPFTKAQLLAALRKELDRAPDKKKQPQTTA